MINLGRILSRPSGTLKPPQLCQTWGCGLKVGKHSAFGLGPICLVCELDLRTYGTRDEKVTKIQTPTPCANQYCSRKDACLRKEVLPEEHCGSQVAL